jgi:MFS family permease
MQEQTTIMAHVTPVRARCAGLWRHKDFLRFWIGQTISEFGSGLGALSLTAILQLGASPAEVGVLAALGGLPVLLVVLQAGVWVDRIPRRPVFIAADPLSALLMLSVPLAWFLGVLWIEQVYVVTFVSGILTVFFRVAHQSLIPSLVEREHIVEANAKLYDCVADDSWQLPRGDLAYVLASRTYARISQPW